MIRGLRFVRSAFTRKGSTRAAALLRMSLAAILLARYAQELTFFRADDAAHFALSIAFTLLVPMMFIGLLTAVVVPMTAILLAVMYFHFGFSVGIPGWNHHHAYLLMISVALLSFAPSGRSLSADRWIARQRAEQGRGVLPPERGRLWPLRLISVQLSAIYFWAAFDKSSMAFLSGQRLEQMLIWHHAGRPLAGLLFLPSVLAAASVAVVAVEYFLAAALQIPRLAGVALVVGVGLHALLFLLLPVETFSVTMIALYLAVLNPEKVHRAVSALIDSGAPAPRPAR